MKYTEMTEQELEAEISGLRAQYKAFQAMNLKLDMSRGKPNSDQLDFTNAMFDTVDSNSTFVTEHGIDVRNYGALDGLVEARELMAELMGVSAEETIVGGNASLNLMYDTVSRSFTHGNCDSDVPWYKLQKVKFLCPVPGYDRHFRICEHFGFEMINIPMDENGPDMNLVEKLVHEDDSIKGIWCVPKYSNPSGITFSDEVVRRFANLSPAAKDFRIFWDNAYCIHDLYDEGDELLDLFAELKKNGKEDMIYIFASTSKISFAGSGLAAMACSKRNIEFIKKMMGVQIICFDKVNQLMHVRYFKNLDGMRAQMKKHANVLCPKFEIILKTFEEELSGLGVATWTKPKGGYFISFNTLPNCAKKTVQMCKEAGVVLTGAGATYPYGIDPADSNIRVAPSYPNVDELETASKLLALCTRLVAAEMLKTGKA